MLDANSHALDAIDYGMGKKKQLTYLVGFALCVILTFVPFSIVMHRSLSTHATIASIYGFAVLQFLVQTLCFVRLNARTEQSRLNLMSFIFFIVILLVIVFGSLWIMVNLNYNMMH